MAKSPTPAANVEERSSRTVTVACKIPHGLQLQLVRKTSYVEETLSGSRDRVRYDRTGARVMIYGPGRPVNPPPGFPDPHPMAGGYALTHDVDSKFWEQWLEQNKLSPIVKNGLIFAMSSSNDVKAKAREQADFRSGLEPLNMEGDARMPKPRNAAVGGITKADVAAA
jgi:hypothetical protein